MARKHKRSALEAMLAVRTAPTQKIEAPAYDGRTGLQKFTATETAREKEAQDEVIRNAETALADSLQARRDDIARTIFTEPSAELQERCTLISGRVAGSVEDIRAQIHEAFNSFRLESENSGVRLEPAGIEKMNRVAAQNMKVDYRDPQSFSELFNLLESLNCFTDHDRTITRQPERVEPIAQPQRTLEGLNTDTVEGRKQASALMLQENQYEAASHFSSFAAQIQRDFHYQLDSEETDALCNQMRGTNRSWTVNKNWHISRLELVKRGTLPQTLRYPSEVLDELIEVTPNTWAGKQELKRQERLLNAQ